MISVDRKSNKNFLYVTLTISLAFALIDVVCSRISYMTTASFLIDNKPCSFSCMMIVLCVFLYIDL